MSWFKMWDGLIKKTCKYLLQRYLGQFLEDNLNLEQLEIDLFNGKASLKNVSLKVDALNSILENQGWAVEVQSGKLGVLNVTVPWNSLMTSDSSIEVSDAYVTLRPIKRQNCGKSMIESMWSSVSSSIQLAEECMKQTEGSEDIAEQNPSSIVGLEKFAETLDNVLNRIKAKLKNTVLRLEYPSPNGERGMVVVINIEELNYQNKTSADKYRIDYEIHDASNPDTNSGRKQFSKETTHLLPTFAKHFVTLKGLKFYTEEYYAHKASMETSQCKSYNDKIAGEAIYTQELPILEIKQQVDIEIKIKQSEEISGPKICLDVELGTIYAFLSPRQLHLVIKMWSAFFEEEDLVDLTGYYAKKHHRQKSERANQGIRKSYMSGMLSNSGNWTSTFHESESMPALSALCDNFNIKGNVYSDSMASSVSSGSTAISTIKLDHRLINADKYGEILTFNIRMAGFVGIILHEDILVESNTNTNAGHLNESSQKDMFQIAHQFFSSLNSEMNSERILYSCVKNHIYISIAPILSEGTQYRNNNMLLFKCKITATKLDIDEVLEEVPTSIIAFDRTENCIGGYHKRPEVMITLKSTTCNLKNTSTTNCDVNLEKVVIEVDVTIYDRMTAVLGPSPFVKGAWSRKEKKSFEKENYQIQQSPLFEITGCSSSLSLKLRFPITDVRPIHDPQRIPWWKKNIRTDFLLVVFNNMSLKIGSENIDIFSNAINAYYCEQNIENQLHLFKSELIDYGTYLAKPKITIKVPHQSTLAKSLNKYSHITGTSVPFSSERVCRESDTLHSTSDENGQSEYIMLPAESKQLDVFCEAAMQSSKVQIHVDLPAADIIIESKQIYEILYNRLNGDLLMWEPSSPILKNLNIDENSLKDDILFGRNCIDSIYVPSTSGLHVQAENLFDTCKLTDTLHDVEINDSAQIENEYQSFNASESIYFSAHQAHESKASTIGLLSSICAFEVVIAEGTLALHVPVRDTENRVLPEQLGKFDLRLNNLKLFCVSGYKGNSNLGYVCVQLQDIEVYHCGIMPSQFDKTFGGAIPEFMQSTLYKIPKGLTKGKCIKNEKREMVSLVIEVKKLPEQRIKRLRLTTGIQMATLRYNPAPAQRIWLNQLIDFFDVTDYPINGYSPYGVITEIQVHLWSCAIDYRPKSFPYRALLEFGSFTICSNIISSMSGCSLRFIVEELVLSIAPFKSVNDEPADNKVSCVKSRDLVPVFDVGLLDISLRVCEQLSAAKCPKIDLRCSIHDCHLRTCYDSGCALAQLIAFVVKDGDTEVNENNQDTIWIPPTEQAEVDMFSSCDLDSYISKEQHDRVTTLMAEALQETVTSSSQSSAKCTQSLTSKHGAETFYFPDENEQTKKENRERLSSENELSDILNFESNVMQSSYQINLADDPLPHVKADFGNLHQQLSAEKDEQLPQEHDYCIIANDEKSYMYQYGIRNIEVHEDPLRIVDNHFCLPTKRPDLLKSPDGFPTPTFRYTLCEMTFTWHLYGGNDFHDCLLGNEANTCKKETLRMSEAYKYGVSYSKGTKDIHFHKKPKEKLTWKSEGGPQRDYEVLVEIQLSKVRFSHEIYPNCSTYASRQVLLISEIEIRDRLQTSDINKFLYHPNLKNLPNKSSQHMVVIKAIHIRPHPKRNLSKECSLRISLLPIRLHIDQGTLEFLADYFTNMGNKYNEINSTLKGIKPKIIEPHAPIMHVSDMPEAVQNSKARKLVETNLELLMNDDEIENEAQTSECAESQTTEESLPIYFREIIFSPEVPICLDYHGRHVELSRGPVAGLLMGLGQLRCSEIRLRKLVCRRGILGLERMMNYLCKEWLKDIKRNQLSKILSGVGPTQAFVQLFQGIYDLFWLPIEQYQKDGRIIKGLQLGAQSFTARTALAALELTSRIIYLLQFTAETAFDMVSPGPSIKRINKYRKGKKKRTQRPKDIREGVANAYFIVKEGINDSANTLVETAVAEHDQKGYTGAVGAVVRHIPQLVVCPAMLATQATTNILGGVKNSLVPDAKIEAQDKWKDSSD